MNLATMEDKSYQIDHWTFLFKSTTWEEIIMLAKDNAYITDAASTVHQLSPEEKLRLQYEAMEDYYRTQLDLMHEMEKRDAKIKALYAEKEKLLAEKEKLLAWILMYLTMNHYLDF